MTNHLRSLQNHRHRLSAIQSTVQRQLIEIRFPEHFIEPDAVGLEYHRTRLSPLELALAATPPETFADYERIISRRLKIDFRNQTQIEERKYYRAGITISPVENVAWRAPQLTGAAAANLVLQLTLVERDYRQAVYYYEKYMSKIQTPWAHLAYIKILYGMREHRAALQCLEKIMKTSRLKGEVLSSYLIQQGLLHSALGQSSAALTAYTAARANSLEVSLVVAWLRTREARRAGEHADALRCAQMLRDYHFFYGEPAATEPQKIELNNYIENLKKVIMVQKNKI